MVAPAKANELKINRVYDAPVAIVWDAWVDPAQAAQWWGPRGFTLTTHSKDLRPGGTWKYTMHGPDGTDYENHTVYHEVVEHAKLVYDHGGYEDHPPMFRVTVLFQEIDGKTHMDMTMALPTPEAAAEAKAFIKKAGGNATWDRLAEYLEHQSTGKVRFVINRTFDASMETLFEMWTNPAHLAQWLPPAGLRMEFVRADIRSGGSTLFFMSGNDIKFHARFDYRQVDKPKRIAYTQVFCDEQEQVCRHPLMTTFPATMLTTIDLTAEGPNQTRVTVTTEPVGFLTKEELAAFIEARAGMTLGWTGSFDQLEELMSKPTA